MPERLIFVSCGQKTPTEKALGRAIQQTIDSAVGFKAYFADDVQSLTALRDHVFDAIRRCTAAVVVLHQREDGGSSMWVNQEVAMLAYRQYIESAAIPVLVFKEPSVKIEGTMSELIMNPRPLTEDGETVAAVRMWLATDAEHGPSDRRASFDIKWQGLGEREVWILRAVVEEGGSHIAEASIRRRLAESHGLDKGDASETLRAWRLGLAQKNLVRLEHTSNGDGISLHPSWADEIRRAAGRP